MATIQAHNRPMLAERPLPSDIEHTIRALATAWAHLAGAGRLRNILIHGYLDIDRGRLYDPLWQTVLEMAEGYKGAGAASTAPTRLARQL